MTGSNLPLKHSGLAHTMGLDADVEDWLIDIDARVKEGIHVANSLQYVATNDPIVAMTGWRAGAGLTNIIRIMYCD